MITTRPSRLAGALPEAPLFWMSLCSLLALVLAMTPAVGQEGPAGPVRPDSVSQPMVIDRIVRDRWIQGGQHPGFVPFDSVRDFVHVRTRRTGRLGSDRAMTLRLRQLEADLTLDASGRIRFARYSRRDLMVNAFDDAADRAQARRRGYRELRGATLRLPAARLWDIPVVLPGTPLRVGTAWTDTLLYVADPGEGLLEELQGVWRHEVVGDTTVDGRTLPLVQTLADVSYHSVEPVRDYAVEGAFVVEHRVSGTVEGRAAVDEIRGVRAAGADTAAWTGEALLRLQDGRTFSTPLRYERQRTWSLMDSTVWAVLQDSLTAQRRRQARGMLTMPRTAIEERLAAGDETLVDSLLTSWERTTDPNERQSIDRLLSMAFRGDPRQEGVHRRLAELREQAGDSISALRPMLAERAHVTDETLDRTLPYLNDLGRMWSLGIVPQFTYGGLAAKLLKASPILEPDSARWGCTPSACRRLLALADEDGEARLRDVALVGAFARDPTRGREALQARADSGSLLVRRALRLADGVGASWPAAPKDPMPPPGADWRLWLSWMGGTVRFEGSHRDALLMYAAHTGRDPLPELVAQWATVQDSARLVLGTILRHMGAVAPAEVDDLAEHFRSGDPLRVQEAAQELSQLMRREARVAEAALATEVLAPLIDSILVGGESPWPATPGLRMWDGDRVLPSHSVSSHGVEGVPRFILGETLPPRLADSLRDRIEPTDSATWMARPPRQGGYLLRFKYVASLGPFLSINWDWTVHQERAPEESPVGYAGGGSLYLLRTPEGWVVVERGAWIT